MCILVVGSVALDTIETPHGRADRVVGGSAVYFSLAASYFSPVRLVGVVGEDFPPDAEAMLERRGVDLSGLEIASGKTFFWHGRYSENFASRISVATELNVFERFSPKIPESFRDSQFVFLANIRPRLQMDVLDQIRRPTLVMADTMNYWIENTPDELAELMQRVDGMIINDEETVMLGRRPWAVGRRPQAAGRRKEGAENRAQGTENTPQDTEDNARSTEDYGRSTHPELQITNYKLQTFDGLCSIGRQLLDLGMKAIVIKRGADGAVLITEETGDVHCPACSVPKVVDPTGAGDAFAGGFIGSLAQSNDASPQAMWRAMLHATALASFAIEDFGSNALANLSYERISERVAGLQKSIRK